MLVQRMWIARYLLAVDYIVTLAKKVAFYFE
jgi:hypothetical protein